MTPQAQVPTYALALLEVAQRDVKRHVRELQSLRPELDETERRELLAGARRDLAQALQLLAEYEQEVYGTA